MIIILSEGSFRLRGDIVEIFPAHLETTAWRIEMFGDNIECIYEIDSLTGEKKYIRENKSLC